ncbi:MAG: 1,4-dihydroxy-2-naphthoate polyprenyltransferase [Myxococcales bacterium]|nr:1,4-dihydroxy-2-naphthoate polyprenyltransferase [Myxococcales bacterium]
MSEQVGATPARGSLLAWVLAARPATLSAAVVPVVVGTACAYTARGLRLGPALAALAGACCIQVGTNFANDLFDFEKGADTADRLGPVRAAQAGLLTPRALRVGTFVVFALAVLTGVYLTAVAGPAVVVVGVAAILSGLAYTGGPYPLGYNGLGDLFVMVFFGFVAVCTTAFVQVGAVPAVAVWASVPVGALATAILVVNNVRDAEGDARAGKRTLAVRLGRRAGVLEYQALVVTAYAVPVLLLALSLSGPWVLLPLVTLPAGAQLSRRIAREHGAALNPVLVGTAKLQLFYGLLFAAGLALGS